MSESGTRFGGGRWRVARAFACAAVVFAAADAASAAGIVRWVDKQGVTHYSNVPGDAKQQPTATPVTSAAPANPPVRNSRASIFKFRDATGVTHYTDRKPAHRNYTVISIYCPACDPKSPIDWTHTRLNMTAFADTVKANADANGVDPAFVRAIIHAESAFNAQALSRKGAQGLMQLMPSVQSDYGVADAFDAAENIRAGTQHLAYLIKEFNGDLDLVAAAYNAGAGAVRKYGGIPPYDETRVYVQRVGTLHRRYGTEFAGVKPVAPVVAPAVTGAAATTTASAVGSKLPR